MQNIKDSSQKPAPAFAHKAGSSLFKKLWKARWFYIMLLPGAVYFIVYRYVPMWGLLIAFQNYMPNLGVFGSEWVGFKHFAYFFSSDRFMQLFTNTLALSLGSLAFAFPAPILLALLLNEIWHSTYKRVMQTLMYLPHFLSTVVICSIAYTMFSTEEGIINNMLPLLGLEKINILMSPSAYRPLFIGLEIWKSAGWGTIIYLAALSGIDVQMYEAAKIEGANRLHQAWHITLPTIKTLMILKLILSLGDILDIGVEKTLLLGNAMNREVAEVFDSFVYRTGIQNAQFSYSAAVGMFKSLVGLILVLGANWLSKKFQEEAIY